MINQTDRWLDLIKLQFHAKEYYFDMVRDFCDIVAANLVLFGDDKDEFETERAKKAIKLMADCNVAPTHHYRIYLVSGIQFFSAAWVTDSTQDYNSFIKAVENEFSLCERMQTKGLDPNLVTTLYVFEKEKIVLAEHMYPSHLAWLLEKLSKVNLIRIE